MLLNNSLSIGSDQAHEGAPTMLFDHQPGYLNQSIFFSFLIRFLCKRTSGLQLLQQGERPAKHFGRALVLCSLG